MFAAAWRKTEGKMREFALKSIFPNKFQAYETLDLAHYAIRNNFLDAQTFTNLFINKSKLLLSVLAPDSKQS